MEIEGLVSEMRYKEHIMPHNFLLHPPEEPLGSEGANRSETAGRIAQKHIWPRQGYILGSRCSLQVFFIVWLCIGAYLYTEQIRLYEFNMDLSLKSPSGGGPKCLS